MVAVGPSICRRLTISKSRAEFAVDRLQGKRDDPRGDAHAFLESVGEPTKKQTQDFRNVNSNGAICRVGALLGNYLAKCARDRQESAWLVPHLAPTVAEQGKRRFPGDPFCLVDA